MSDAYFIGIVINAHLLCNRKAARGSVAAASWERRRGVSKPGGTVLVTRTRANWRARHPMDGGFVRFLGRSNRPQWPTYFPQFHGLKAAALTLLRQAMRSCGHHFWQFWLASASSRGARGEPARTERAERGRPLIRSGLAGRGTPRRLTERLKKFAGPDEEETAAPRTYFTAAHPLNASCMARKMASFPSARSGG